MLNVPTTNTLLKMTKRYLELNVLGKNSIKKIENSYKRIRIHSNQNYFWY